MKKYLSVILYALFLVSGSICFAQNIEPQKASIEETLVIGTSDSNPDYFFGDLSYASLAVDENRKIYVPDNTEMSIKVYDKKHKNLLVLDYMSQRASFFDKEGNLKQSVKIDPKKISWPRKVLPHKNGYLVLAKSRRSSKSLFTVYDNQFQTKQAEFGSINRFLYTDYFGEKAHYGFDPGSMAVMDNKIYYAPPFYRGFIYRFQNTKDIQSIKGYIYKKKPYLVLDIKSERYNKNDIAKPYHINGRTRGQRYTMRLHNYHRGVFITNRGKLVNFTMIENKETRDFGVEIFDIATNELLNYYVLESVPLENNVAVNISKFPKAIDSENNFYMIEYGDKHLVKRFRLNVPELQQ